MYGVFEFLASIRIIKKSAEALGCEWQVARDRLLKRTYHAEWEDLLEVAIRLEYLFGGPLNLVGHRAREFVAARDALYPILDYTL